MALLSILEEDADSTLASATPKSIGNGFTGSCRFWKSFYKNHDAVPALPAPPPANAEDDASIKSKSSGNSEEGEHKSKPPRLCSRRGKQQRAAARRCNSQSDASPTPAGSRAGTPVSGRRFWSRHRQSAPQIRAQFNNNLSVESAAAGAERDRRNAPQPALRHTNFERSLSNKKRVIKMLFVVVVEFFVCWTPLYVINTMSLVDPKAVYMGLGYAGILGCYSFAYVSCW